MELSEMTLKELWEQLEGLIEHNPHWETWYGSKGAALRAEFKRQCEASELPSMWWWDGLEQHAKDVGWGHRLVQRLRKKFYQYPACPCPVVGGWVAGVDKGSDEPDRSVWRSIHLCSKCGKWKPWGVSYGGTGLPPEPNVPCYTCQATKPDAPKGYEFVGVWRPPTMGEYYLNYMGAIVHYMNPEAAPSQNIDGGKRWILRKMEGEPRIACPKCGREFNWGSAGWLSMSTNIEFPCQDCIAGRPPTKPGYEYTGDWKYPGWEDYWVSFHGNARNHCYPDRARDQGRRWILKKAKEEVLEGEGWRPATMDEIYALTHRVEKLEALEACFCAIEEDTPEGFLYKLVRDLNGRVEELEKKQ